LAVSVFFGADSGAKFDGSEELVVAADPA